MKKSGWSRLFLGFLLTAAAACIPVTEEEMPLETEPAPVTWELPAIAQQATSTSDAGDTPTIPPPPNPTPLPTVDGVSNWQTIGGETTGLQMAAPSGWVNLSGQLTALNASSPLGLALLLTADSERTGANLLAGKPFGSGAYAVGLLTNGIRESTAVTTLARIVESLGQEVTIVEPAAPLPDSNLVSGAYVDVIGPPLLFADNGLTRLRSRLLLFVSEGDAPEPESQHALFVFSAPADEWGRYADTFDKMAQTAIVHNVWSNVLIGGGAGNVVGRLGEADQVNGRLEAGKHDIWSFRAESGRYATLTARPVGAGLDLILTLIGPGGQTIVRVDNGFAGDAESIVDLLLPQSGTYIVEVRDFFNQSGQYTLSLALTNEPLFSSGGRIRFGEIIQGELPGHAQKVWRFEGTAGQTVSIVLIPIDKFDPILHLYGPNGNRLVALDEGFSGDAEVISGFTLPLTGQYTILIRSFAGDGGQYSISLDEGGEDIANFYDAGDLVYGESKREALRANEAHAWFFAGRSGDEVQIEVRPLNPQLDLEIWLLDEEIQRLSVQHKLGAGQTERITHTLPEDSQYLILVSDYFGQAGEYEIVLTALPAATAAVAGMMSYGDTVAGTLPSNQMVVWYFMGVAGDLIDVELATGEEDRDLLFFIQHPDGNRVIQVDAAGAGMLESITAFPLTANGRWGIVIKEFFGDPSAYTLTIRRNR